MTYTRRMRAARVKSNAPVGQAEYYLPGVYDVTIPDGVEAIHVAAVAAGEQTDPPPGSGLFRGGWGGNYHWRNNIPVTPGEKLTLKVGARGAFGDGLTTYLMRGATVLARAKGWGQEPEHASLGGGGAKGGQPGNGGGGDGGLGGGAAGPMGQGGRGGTWTYTSGTFPEADSGGGRGGDRDGNPTGWANTQGEGVGLLGRAPDKQSSLGPVKVGGGGMASGSSQDGGFRLMFGDDRSYPDNATDRAVEGDAAFVSATSGLGTLPQAMSFHTNAEPGDIVMICIRPTGNGGVTGMTGSVNWKNTGFTYWKQITQADIDASAGGTAILDGTVPMAWGIVVYRGGMVSQQRASGSPPYGDTITIPGVTKRVDSKRMITFAYDPDVTTVPLPSGWTSRVNRTSTGAMRIGDKAASAYNGEPIVYSGMGTDENTLAVLFEIY